MASGADRSNGPALRRTPALLALPIGKPAGVCVSASGSGDLQGLEDGQLDLREGLGLGREFSQILFSAIERPALLDQLLPLGGENLPDVLHPLGRLFPALGERQQEQLLKAVDGNTRPSR